jgi:hypothetical protein
MPTMYKKSLVCPVLITICGEYWYFYLIDYQHQADFFKSGETLILEID